MRRRAPFDMSFTVKRKASLSQRTCLSGALMAVLREDAEAPAA